MAMQPVQQAQCYYETICTSPLYSAVLPEDMRGDEERPSSAHIRFYVHYHGSSPGGGHCTFDAVAIIKKISPEGNQFLYNTEEHRISDDKIFTNFGHSAQISRTEQKVEAFAHIIRHAFHTSFTLSFEQDEFKVSMI